MYRSLHNMRNVGFMVISAVTLGFTACDKDDDDDDEKVSYTISATADGAQEVPAVNTDGTGTVTGTYNKNTKIFSYTVTWKDLSGPATNMHFHGPALPGTPAGVAIPIVGFSSVVEGSHTGTDTLTAEQETDMLGGKWYYNVHTDAYPAGEIRGQLEAE